MEKTRCFCKYKGGVPKPWFVAHEAKGCKKYDKKNQADPAGWLLKAFKGNLGAAVCHFDQRLLHVFEVGISPPLLPPLFPCRFASRVAAVGLLDQRLLYPYEAGMQPALMTENSKPWKTTDIKSYLKRFVKVGFCQKGLLIPFFGFVNVVHFVNCCP